MRITGKCNRRVLKADRVQNPQDFYTVENFRETLDLVLECNVTQAFTSIARWLRRRHFQPVIK